MKKSTVIFAVCLAALGIRGVAADDADTARAARRQTATPATGTTTLTNSSRQQTSAKATTTPTTTASRSTATASTTPKVEKNVSSRGATTTGTRDSNIISESVRHATGTVGMRTAATTTAPRTTTAARGAISTQSRAAVTPARTGIASTRTPVTASRSATKSSRIGMARAADATTIRDSIIQRDYATCRTVYYDCMDEFCANKNSQLKRCACSARIHEFDNVKKRLAQAEEKMLDFSERLLLVNMDKEDAAAIFVETEGENAFNTTKDTSDSKKILDEIAKKLKTGTTDDSFNQGMQSISLSLDVDAAFDNVDSLQGADTTTKEGVALYNAALPICREMAAEVCDQDSLDLAVSGYQMAIEQDCTTVAKTYSTQADQARTKIREGSALLDMSRLDTYQKRNSDDILTCKKKMLTQLTNTTVCGENLSRCLDITGQYIDPSTGQAFLTGNLAELGNLITHPTGDDSWMTAPGNVNFVKYLQSKKKYLEPATENCQNIADDVWDAFLEDALAQIKLAQDAKLEEVRQSCTTLTTQCLADTAKSLSDFDARALSTFGVAADKTVNDMCANVRNSCTALMSTGTSENNDWIGGMTQIATEKTYDTILHTCREVGRACIIQVCKSVSGNFGLCENMDTSVNRKSIINRTACWDQVRDCVKSAGEDAIKRIFTEDTKVNFDRNNNGTIQRGGSFYTELYDRNNNRQISIKSGTDQTACGEDYTCIYDICYQECRSSTQDFGCRVCRIAEKIWGNCEADPKADLTAKGTHNKILTPSGGNAGILSEQPSTLLSWFAENTGTQNRPDSCRDTTACPEGYTLDHGTCRAMIAYTTDGAYCPVSDYKMNITSTITNCCGADPDYKTLMPNGDCCETHIIQHQSYANYYTYDLKDTDSISAGLCDITANGTTTYQPLLNYDGNWILVCQGTISATNDGYQCSGRFIMVNANNEYMDMLSEQYMYYVTQEGKRVYDYGSSPTTGPRKINKATK